MRQKGSISDILVRLFGGEDGWVGLDGWGEVLIEDGERQFGGVDADRTESFEDTGTAIVLGGRDGLEVLVSIVGSDTVLMVDIRLFFGYRSYPRDIDGMRDEDVYVTPPNIMEYQIPLFSFSIILVRTVWTCSGKGFLQSLYALRRDLQTDFTITRDIEPISVVGFVGNEVQECALVQDNWINRMIHIHRVLGDRSGGLGDVPESPGVEPLDPKSDAKVEV